MNEEYAPCRLPHFNNVSDRFCNGCNKLRSPEPSNPNGAHMNLTRKTSLSLVHFNLRYTRGKLAVSTNTNPVRFCQYGV